MAAIMAIRAGMFSISGKPQDDQINVFLTFIGGGLATAATVLGALFTWEHNRRERRRLGLDTAINSLSYLNKGAQPQVAGVLASMMLLGQPHIAIRVLAPAWDEKQVEAGTATWLIGQVLPGGRARAGIADGDLADNTVMSEASALLLRHAEELTGEQPRSYCFPDQFFQQWRTKPKLPKQIKIYLLAVAGRMLASRDMHWWWRDGHPPDWPTGMLEECAIFDDDEEIRWSATILLSVLYSCNRKYFEKKYTQPGPLAARLDYRLLAQRLEEASEMRDDLRKGKQGEAAGEFSGRADPTGNFILLAEQIRMAWESNPALYRR